MITPEVEDTPAGHKIEVFISLIVEEIGALRTDVAAVEPGSPQHTDPLRVDILIKELEVATAMLSKDILDVDSQCGSPLL